MAVKDSKEHDAVDKGSLEMPSKSKKNAFQRKFRRKWCGVKISKHHDDVDESSLEVPSRSKMKMNSNGCSEGNGVAVKDSKHHDVIDEGSLEMLTKSKKKTNSNDSSEGNGMAEKVSVHHVLSCVASPCLLHHKNRSLKHSRVMQDCGTKYTSMSWTTFTYLEHSTAIKSLC